MCIHSLPYSVFSPRSRLFPSFSDFVSSSFSSLYFSSFISPFSQRSLFRFLFLSFYFTPLFFFSLFSSSFLPPLSLSLSPFLLSFSLDSFFMFHSVPLYLFASSFSLLLQLSFYSLSFFSLHEFVLPSLSLCLSLSLSTVSLSLSLSFHLLFSFFLHDFFLFPLFPFHSTFGTFIFSFIFLFLVLPLFLWVFFSLAFLSNSPFFLCIISFSQALYFLSLSYFSQDYSIPPSPAPLPPFDSSHFPFFPASFHSPL